MNYKLRKILRGLSAGYSPDLRALAFMRIGIGLVIIVDLIIRGTDLTAHYTNEGIWPTQLVKHLGWKPGFWSLHTLNGSYNYILFLFSIQFITALFLIAGFKTRIASLLLWLFAISLHNRNIYVQQAGDDLLRLILFWGIFLPWHAKYSIDSLSIKTAPQKNVFSALGYFILLASVYFFSVLHKTSSEWWQDGTAVYYALSLGQLRLAWFGDLIYGYPQVLKYITWLVIGIEVVLPLLILWPSKKGTPRLIAFCLIVLLHAGIGLTLYVGLFFVIGIVSALGLLPSFVMDKITGINTPLRLPGRSTKTTQLINSLCIIVIFLSLMINLGTVRKFPYQLSPALELPVNVFRFDQRWTMFSPGITKKDGWFVYQGLDSSGKEWDLGTNSAKVDYTRPPHIVSMYKTDRWRKLAENMQNDLYSFLRPLYGNYILKEWNKNHPGKKIQILNLYFMEVENLPGYRTTDVKKNLYCVCYDQP